MSDERSIQRRSLLRNAVAGVAGVGGLALASGSADAAVGPDVIRTQGDLTRVEAAAKLQDLGVLEDVDAQDDECYTETKCTSGCSGNGEVAYRECCVHLGCGEWNYTDHCC
ncbi:hypothetical protein BRC81_02445 [Halobacteriales archaeon QS_1_68_20]|nr:MAG: hypothetical protein BRC81_02445 [Halobacteriales archaeon QS_1_68_20]